MKRVFVILAVLVVLLVAGVLVLFSSLGTLVKGAVETVGSEATGATVTLAEADISVTSGKGALRRLVVGNPPGFATASAFSLGEVSIALDTASIGSDTVVIDSIVIEAPEVTYELGSSGSNIAAIQANVDAFAKAHGAGGGDAEEPAQGEAAAEDGTKLHIRRLVVRGGKVHVSATFLGGKKVGAALPETVVEDIGKDGGASVDEIATAVIGVLTDITGTAVDGLGLDEMMEGVTKKASDAVGAGVEKAGEAVKDLFGK